jgi:hypothetical protein
MENELKLQSYNNEMKEFLSKRDTDYCNHQRKITEAKGLLDIAQERKEKIYYVIYYHYIRRDSKNLHKK